MGDGVGVGRGWRLMQYPFFLQRLTDSWIIAKIIFDDSIVFYAQ